MGRPLIAGAVTVFALLWPGRRPAAVCPGQHGRGGSDVGRADSRHPEAVGRHRSADVLRPLTGVSAQRLGILVRSPVEVADWRWACPRKYTVVNISSSVGVSVLERNLKTTLQRCAMIHCKNQFRETITIFQKYQYWCQCSFFRRTCRKQCDNTNEAHAERLR